MAEYRKTHPPEMKFILRGMAPAQIREHSEEMRRLFDYAIRHFGSVKVVNEFSELPDDSGWEESPGHEHFEWGESRYVEIPTDKNPEKWGIFLLLARKLNISVEPINDPQPQKITW